MTLTRSPVRSHTRSLTRGLTELVGGGSTPAAPPVNHTDGLLHEWLFTEGSGTTVADEIGSSDIDLDAATTPGYTWTARGLTLSGGAVSPPANASIRTFVALLKTTRAQTGGFMIAGGTANNQGLQQNRVQNDAWMGDGMGVHAIRRNSSDGTAAIGMNGGSYVLLFYQVPSATIRFAMGGRAKLNDTASRCGDLEVIWAAAYDDNLSDAERTQIWNYVGYLAAQRSVYLRASDCPARRDAVILIGESTMEGRSSISSLSTDDQNQVFTYSDIVAGDFGSVTYPPATFDLGVNQTLDSVSTWFGPELGFAQKAETATRNLVICKMAEGGMHACPTDTLGSGDPAASENYHPTTLISNSIVHDLFEQWYYLEQHYRNLGIGLTFLGYQNSIGINDTYNTGYVADAATYQGYMQAIHDDIETYVGATGFRVHVTIAHDNASTADATAAARVRTGQADFVTALGSNADSYDLENLTLYDTVHTNDSVTIGEQGYEWLINGVAA